MPLGASSFHKHMLTVNDQLHLEFNQPGKHNNALSFCGDNDLLWEE